MPLAADRYFMDRGAVKQMKNLMLVLLAGCFITMANAADFQRVTVQPQGEQKVVGPCIGDQSTLQLKNDVISVIAQNGESYSLNADEQTEALDAYFGSDADSGLCVMAIKYAENEVNESFSLFVFDPQQNRFKPSAVKTITNPEFTNNQIISYYKDGPTNYTDTLCFESKDYFPCEKREWFAERLGKQQMCEGEDACAVPDIISEATGQPVNATIASAKVYLLNKNDEAVFTQRKAYLVRGDSVTLNDYVRSDEGLYFQVTFVGKVKTIGWVPAKSLNIEY
ncbi:hypothetical protein [Pseudomonas frederiksbergensis]|uniref:hypothetical protein n=1 Tax=Pseudomonas frederiksbergensis TaxID=104087 RepID=UPI003D1AA39D